MKNPDRRFVLSLLPVSLGVLAGTPAAMAQPPARRGSVNVRDFGAVGDGVTDDTAAFNRATRATSAWSTALELAVFVPAGRYRIRGTVYIRKGQTLYGEGLSSHIDASDATQSTFVLGKRSVDGKAFDDPGGSPVRISNIRGLGGAATHGFIYTNAQGFQIADLFLSATGIGLEIEAADGIISDITIDMCLNGIIFRRCQNIVATNMNIFLPNYAISFMGDCRDIALSNIIVSYTKYISILFGEGTKRISNILLSNCIFANNEQFETFAGYIHNRASQVSAMFTACSFRNWPRHAISHGAGSDVALSFDGCAFDGTPTNPVYNKSQSARCISTGSGRYRFTNCEFRNLHGEIASTNASLVELAILGGRVADCAADRFRFASSVGGKISVQGVDGFAHISRNRASSRSISLPWWGTNTVWRLRLHGDDYPAREILIAVGKDDESVDPTAKVITNWSFEPDIASVLPDVTVSKSGPAAGTIRIDIATGSAQADHVTVGADTL